MWSSGWPLRINRAYLTKATRRDYRRRAKGEGLADFRHHAFRTGQSFPAKKRIELDTEPGTSSRGGGTAIRRPADDRSNLPCRHSSFPSDLSQGSRLIAIIGATAVIEGLRLSPPTKRSASREPCPRSGRGSLPHFAPSDWLSLSPRICLNQIKAQPCARARCSYKSWSTFIPTFFRK